MNRILLGTKGLGEIKDIHADMAFGKGVEWFTELVFFYGVLFVITAYEFKKADVASTEQKHKITSLTDSTKTSETRITSLETALSDAEQ